MLLTADPARGEVRDAAPPFDPHHRVVTLLAQECTFWGYTHQKESMSSRRMTAKECEPSWCPIETALDAIGGMWKVIIVRELLRGTRRYSELHRAVKHVTHKMLAQQLRELERDGLVIRKVYAQVPPKVEYSLTLLGRGLGPVLESMHRWGERVMASRAAATSVKRRGRRSDAAGATA
jgi:DNA-binding HxlR family transcriptional regulator